MLKNKSVLDKFDLVEELEDQIAETINGGITIRNTLFQQKSILVINPANLNTTSYQLQAGGQIQVPGGENLFFVWDQDNVANTWDLAIKGGFISTDYLELSTDANGKVTLDYDLAGGGGQFFISSIATSP